MTTAMTTTAQRISSLLDDDGQRWHDAKGRHLNGIAETQGGKRVWRDHTDTYRWEFPDGSALLVAGDCWGFPLSKTAAKRRAHDESHMYRQGGGWITSTWSDHYGCNELSDETPYFVARSWLAEWRRNYASGLRFEMETR